MDQGAPPDEGVEGLAVEEADDGVAEPRRQRGEHDLAGQVEERVAARHGPDGEILHGRLIQKPRISGKSLKGWVTIQWENCLA